MQGIKHKLVRADLTRNHGTDTMGTPNDLVNGRMTETEGTEAKAGTSNGVEAIHKK